MTVVGTHDHTLVALSILIATAASYTALDLAGRIRAADGWARHCWLATSAVAMGGGIWSMHFVAMLALAMPGMDVTYDVGLTALSLFVPIVVTGIGFFLVRGEESNWRVVGFSGLLMGVGIAAMHYTGMAAMRMAAAVSYDKLWVALSVLIAIGASTIALWLAFKNTGILLRLVAAVAMGFAISGMHYAAMVGAVFTAHPAVDDAHGTSSLGQMNLALAVAGTTFLILFLALVASMFDRRFAFLAEREAAALRRSEEQFRALYRKAPLPLHALDIEGMVEEASDAWLQLLGYAREEVVARPLTSFMSEESADRHVQTGWPALMAEGQVQGAEYRFMTRSGDVLDVLLSARIERDNEGGFLWATGGLVDITARRRAEEALRQAQKMEAMGQLTGGVAHDFNNLLAVVLGNLELVRKRLKEDPKSLGMVENALEGARRGAALTQRMLSFARQQSLQPEVIDVRDLVLGMEDLLQRSLGPQVQIDTQFPLGLSRVSADANQLELSVLNLVVNGRDAMPEGGVIRIAAQNEWVSAGDANGLAAGMYVRLSVADTGEGMDEATLARAREPFFTTKAIGKGTGLGLSMVHGFAQQSGGTLVINSRKGHGTVVEIWLPAAEAEGATSNGAEDHGEPSEQQSSRPAVILAVDDDALVLMNTVAMLEDLGHTVFGASSGGAALDIVRREPSIEMVITDHAMPGMTGLELAATIRAEMAHIPVLLVTGYSDPPIGCSLDIPRLGKPFAQEALARAVEACRVGD